MSNTQLATIKKYLENDEVKTRLRDMLDKNADTFAANLVTLVGSNNQLQKCSPESIMKSAMVAASLNLAIHPSIGHAYIIPYGDNATFQIGYKGLIQLAQRSGKIKKIHVCEVYSDEIVRYDYIKGEIEMTGVESKERESGTATPAGYYATIELNNGFYRDCYMTVKEITNHARKYSKTFNNKTSPWQTEFDAMAKKTVLIKLVKFCAPLSINEMVAVTEDQDTEANISVVGDSFIDAEIIDIDAEENTATHKINTDTKDDTIKSKDSGMAF